jgi:hypothetical protein
MEDPVRGQLEFVKWAMMAFCLLTIVPRGTAAQGGAGSGGLPTCTGWSNCNKGQAFCTSPSNAGTSFGMPGVIADFADGVSSDGRGPYVPQYVQLPIGRMSGAVQSGAAIGFPPDTTKNPRTLTINLNRPVPGGGGVPLGIITDGDDNGVYTQMQRIGDAIPNFHDIPVGQTVTAGMMTVMFHVNGRFHLLQMGPNAFGHCHIPATLVNGLGTSSGTIHRASPRRWVMDLPAGSIGRLFDLSHKTENAVDKGLYYVHLHYEVGADVQTGVLVGRVTDVDGNGPLDHAGVNLRLPDGVLVAGTATHADGTYRLPAVPVGTYQVQIRKQGFLPHEAGKVTIRADQTDTLNAVLKTTGGRTHN